jgi:L-threonine synthase (EC 4.2.3.1)
LKDLLKENEWGVFCETAHPAKFKDTVESAINTEITIPDRLADFMQGKKQSVSMTKDFADFKAFLVDK